MTNDDGASHLRLPIEVLREVRLPAIEALKKAEFVTLDDLCSESEAELLRILGAQRDIQTIKTGLARYGLKLREGRE